MSKFHRRSVAGLAATALGLTGAVVGTAPMALAAEECVADSTAIQIFSFNDFHGRVEEAAKLFTVVEDARDLLGEENVLLTSNGDSIGGSTFVSAVADDQPTLDVLNAAGVDVSTAGNHEFDKGWSDLSGRVAAASDFPYVAANIYEAGTTTVAAPLQAYETFEMAGVTVAVTGAVTGDLDSLVSPAGIADLTVGDPVEAVNTVAAQLKDGDDSNGEADIVIASIHEGAPSGSPDAATGAESSQNFADIYNDIHESVDVVFNGHTHYQYDWQTADGRPLLQANDYAQSLMSVTFQVDAEGNVCGGVETAYHQAPEAPAISERLTAINNIVEAAVETAAELGAEVVGEAEQAISTPGNGGSGTRDVESPMSNMVAQMFHDMIGQGDPDFIGVQNPGGTRDSFDEGAVTYEEAALVLPFANSLFTTQLTGAQFKDVLEAQWQRDGEGNVPSRPYLALGLSDNVSYTYDANRDEGDRITGITVSGEPIDDEKLYTFGSGSFLISGGDNFRTFGEGINTADAGLVDLTAWVDWIKEQDALVPDYTKRGVSIADSTTTVPQGQDATFTLGKVVDGDANPSTLDMFLDAEGDKVSPQLPNTSVTAFIGEDEVGTGDVTDGVGTVTFSTAGLEVGTHEVRFVVEPSGTEVRAELVVDEPVATTFSVASVTMQGRDANAWGTVASPATVSTQVKLPSGDWSTSQTREVTEGDSYVIPLTYGKHNAGSLEWRVRVIAEDGTETFTDAKTQERIARTSFGIASHTVAGRDANAWGTVAGEASVSTQVKLPSGDWSTSQTREAGEDGSFIIPLTYGKNAAGALDWRLRIVHENGLVEYTDARTQQRALRPVAASAGSKLVGQASYVWGKADSNATRVFTQVWVDGAWSRSQVAQPDANGAYVIELTYGKHNGGTYRYRVGAEQPGVGVLYSDEFAFVRTIR